MKKQFLTLALLATVAVGGAFASNASKKVTFANYSYNDGTGCKDITVLPDSRCGSGSLTCTINNATVFNGTCDDQGEPVQFHL